MRVMVTVQFWDVINHQKKICNQFFVRKLRLQWQLRKRGSPTEMKIYQQNLFKLTGRPLLMFEQRSLISSGELENGLPMDSVPDYYTP